MTRDQIAALFARRDADFSRRDAAALAADYADDATIDSPIKAVRHAIGDSGAAQALIRTLPRKGVRFVGSVEEERAAAPASGPPACRAGRKPLRADLPVERSEGLKGPSSGAQQRARCADRGH